MKAAILTEIGQPLDIREVPMPVLEPDEALVQTHTCGVCRTDIHIQDGAAYIPNLPHIPGHEPAGIVVSTGSAVEEIQPGQRVVPHLFVRRSECRFTRAGADAQATKLEGILGVTMPGAFAEYFKIRADNLLLLPDDVDFGPGGLVSCAAITAVHAFRRAKLQLGATALVLGSGGIGQMLVQLAQSAGVRTVAVDPNEYCRQSARACGAEQAIDPADSKLDDRVRDFAGPDGIDVVFEMVGRAQTMAQAGRWVRRCGRIVVVGEEPEFPALDTILIAQKELEIVGSRNGGRQDAIDALRFISAGALKPPIAERYPLHAINEALSALRSGKASGRLVIDVR